MTAGSTLRTLPVVATAVPGDSHVVILGPTDIAAAATTTTTTTLPPTTTTVVRKAVVRKVAPKPVVRPRAVPPKPTTTTTTAPARTQTGKASWYDHQPGVCAHRTLPFGTVVTVTDVNNGKSVSCTIGDRGPYVDGWVIDLNPREFEQLAPKSSGVISVRLRW